VRLVAASHVGERARMSNVRKSEINGARPGAYWYGTEYFAQRRPQQAEPATATYFEALYSRPAVSKHAGGPFRVLCYSCSEACLAMDSLVSPCSSSAASCWFVCGSCTMLSVLSTIDTTMRLSRVMCKPAVAGFLEVYDAVYI